MPMSTRYTQDTEISDYFRMDHVTILPPRKLLHVHPVLPVKINKKLVFMRPRTKSSKMYTFRQTELEEAEKHERKTQRKYMIYTTGKKQHSMTQIMEKADSLQSILIGEKVNIL